MFDIATAAKQQDPLLGLVENADAQHVGYVFRMDYSTALVMTNDHWRNRVGGIPLGCILLATEIEFMDAAAYNPDTASLVVVRVIGPARLPQDDEAMRACIEMHQRRTARQRQNEHDGLDGMTHGHLQWGGLECRILGTMYRHNGHILLGADVEDFPSAVQYRVYKPIGAGLEAIVNFVDPVREAAARKTAKLLGFQELPPKVEIGAVRYTSARQKHDASGAAVPVRIQPFDILARRTAVLGMTRTGKSNTTKTLGSEIALAASAGGQKVGQLIFDVNGEYANANHQDDGSSLAEVFEPAGIVVRYRGRDTEGFRDLRPNYYEDFEASLNMLQGLLENEPNPGASQEFKTFLKLSAPEPSQADFSATNRWRVKRALFHAILAKANFEPPQGFKVTFNASKRVVEEVGKTINPNGSSTEWLELAGGKATTHHVKCELSPSDAVTWFENVRACQKGLLSSTGKPWLDDDCVAMVDVLVGRSTHRNEAAIVGIAAVGRQRIYHSPKGTADVAKDVYNELRNGKIVILDLSVGTESVRKAMSERIAKHVFAANLEAFHGGGTPPNVVLYVEEAHNLIGADAKPDETWPRIAKEGAKARIALVYATQEPSSVQRNILANTENLFCTHLNNDDEVRTLSKYYDFADFAQSIKKVQDVGFARVKTLSSAFVVPTQISKFDPSIVRSRLNATRSQPTTQV